MWDEVSFALFSIYTKSARSYVKLVAVCKSIRGSCLDWTGALTTRKTIYCMQYSVLIHTINQVTTMKCLATLRPLSLKLQPRHMPIMSFKHATTSKILRVSYKMSEETSTNIARIGTARIGTARKADIEPSMPHVAARQQYLSNVEAKTPKGLNKRARIMITIFLRWTHTLTPIMMLWSLPSCAYFQPY